MVLSPEFNSARSSTGTRRGTLYGLALSASTKFTQSAIRNSTSLKDAKNNKSPADVNEINNVIAAPTHRYIVNTRKHSPITYDYTLHSQLNMPIKRKSLSVKRPTKFHFSSLANTKHVRFRLRACLFRWMCTGTACAINISPVYSVFSFICRIFIHSPEIVLFVLRCHLGPTTKECVSQCSLVRSGDNFKSTL